MPDELHDGDPITTDPKQILHYTPPPVYNEDFRVTAIMLRGEGDATYGPPYAFTDQGEANRYYTINNPGGGQAAVDVLVPMVTYSPMNWKLHLGTPYGYYMFFNILFIGNSFEIGNFGGSDASGGDHNYYTGPIAEADFFDDSKGIYVDLNESNSISSSSTNGGGFTLSWSVSGKHNLKLLPLDDLTEITTADAGEGADIGVDFASATHHTIPLFACSASIAWQTRIQSTFPGGPPLELNGASFKPFSLT